MTKDDALKLALEALEHCCFSDALVTDKDVAADAILAIREALAQPEQEPVVGTETWFEDGKVVTQYLTAKDIYKEPDQEPVAWQWLGSAHFRKKIHIYKEPDQEPVAHDVIAGALFDFMGWLTSRPKRIMLSSADDASPAVDAIRDFAKMRDLSLDDAKVQDWNTTPPKRKPLTDEEMQLMAKRIEGWVKIEEVREHFDSVGCGTIYKTAGEDRVALYTAPPKREWVGLTDEECEEIMRYEKDFWGVSGWEWECMKSIEAKLKEKNT